MICTVIESHPAPESTRPPGFFCVNPLSHALRLDVINLPLSLEQAGVMNPTKFGVTVTKQKEYTLVLFVVSE